jgi:hypothetical protein
MKMTKDQSAGSSQIFGLWVQLSRAINTVGTGEDLVDRILTPPWESKDPQVVMAWEALTHPKNLDDLIDWGSHELNPRAKEYTAKAIQVCRSRSQSAGEPSAGGNAG